MATLSGHFWTVLPYLARTRVTTHPNARPWETSTAGLGLEGVRLSGLWHDAGDSDLAVILVHGLGGSAESGYVATVSKTMAAAGLPNLRLNLRGADLQGEDMFHAALAEDVDAALASPELSRFSRIVVIGFSLGGHLAMRWAMRPSDPRVSAVGAICPPLDLAACADHLDGPARSVYRTRILRSLKAAHTAASERGRGVAPEARVGALRTIRGWDETVVVPRFGFGSAQAYYAWASVGPRLDQLRVPTLLLEARNDPMIPAYSARLHLRAPRDSRGRRLLTLRSTERGGHVGFPPDLDLGFGGRRGLEGQLIAWTRHVGRRG